jgi:hypothetical protein
VDGRTMSFTSLPWRLPCGVTAVSLQPEREQPGPAPAERRTINAAAQQCFVKEEDAAEKGKDRLLGGLVLVLTDKHVARSRPAAAGGCPPAPVRRAGRQVHVPSSLLLSQDMIRSPDPAVISSKTIFITLLKALKNQARLRKIAPASSAACIIRSWGTKQSTPHPSGQEHGREPATPGENTHEGRASHASYQRRGTHCPRAREVHNANQHGAALVQVDGQLHKRATQPTLIIPRGLDLQKHHAEPSGPIPPNKSPTLLLTHPR